MGGWGMREGRETKIKVEVNLRLTQLHLLH